MTPEDEDISEELRLLIGQVADGKLTGDQKDALRAALAESESARRYYLRYMHVAALVAERSGLTDSLARHRRMRTGSFRVFIAFCGVVLLLATWYSRTRPIAGEGVVHPAREVVSKDVSVPEMRVPEPRGAVTLAAIEISGSMSADGRRFTPVVNRVFDQLAELQPEQPFNVIAFATERRLFRPEPVVATPENLAAARAWVETLRPDGEDAPSWPDGDWQGYRSGRHFGADLLATMAYCFESEPAHIVYATDWVMDPASVRSSKQELIESIRHWQRQRATPVRLDIVVDHMDGHNRFLRDVAIENDGRFFEGMHEPLTYQ
jgi:hypothetical protein